jgi:hypothetical protein
MQPKRPHTGLSSIKIYRVPSASVKLTESLETEIRSQEPNKKERISFSDAQIRTYPRAGSMKSISALIQEDFCEPGEDGKTIIHLSGIWKALHLVSFSTASLDELSLLSTVATVGLERAIDLASKHKWKCQRPLQALRAMMNGHGKSYTKQSAKTRQASGSPASSRKRS